MLQAKAIDVLLSLAFIYMLFSIAVSGLYELYQSAYNLRGRFLKKVITNVLNDPLNSNFAEELYYHPLIDSIKETRKVFPSNINCSHFTDVITDILQYRAKEKSLEFDEFSKKYIVKQSDTYDSLSPFDKLKKGITSLNDSPFKRIAESWIFDIAEDADKNEAIQKAKTNIERWYTNYTDRTLGWFKRDLRKRLLVLGSIVAIAFNVNSLILVEFLWKEDAQREIIVNTAINYVNETDSINRTRNPDSLMTDAERLQRDLNSADKAKDILEDLDLPIGWDNFEGYHKDYFELKENMSGYWPGIKFWVLAAIGWLCTGFAISFGADFWYSAVKKIMGVRKTVKESSK